MGTTGASHTCCLFSIAATRSWSEAGGAAPAVLNAANEVAVAAFLAGQIKFSRISSLVAQVLDGGNLPPAPQSLEDVLMLDRAARSRASNLLETG